MTEWISEHIIEIFGAVTGILYVFLEIRQNILLWPLGIVTSAVYMFVFRENGFYAGMLLQGYYLLISIYGWMAWRRGREKGARSEEQREVGDELRIKRISLKTAVFCLIVSLILWVGMWFILREWTDSPMPLWDGLITSLSVVATWMLTRKILEQWHIWIVANLVAVIVYIVAGMYPTAVLFGVYLIMAVAGLREWRKKLPE